MTSHDLLYLVEHIPLSLSVDISDIFWGEYGGLWNLAETTKLDKNAIVITLILIHINIEWGVSNGSSRDTVVKPF
jgi:hypothetical protein